MEGAFVGMRGDADDIVEGATPGIASVFKDCGDVTLIDLFLTGYDLDKLIELASGSPMDLHFTLYSVKVMMSLRHIVLVLEESNRAVVSKGMQRFMLRVLRPLESCFLFMIIGPEMENLLVL